MPPAGLLLVLSKQGMSGLLSLIAIAVANVRRRLGFYGGAPAASDGVQVLVLPSPYPSRGLLLPCGAAAMQQGAFGGRAERWSASTAVPVHNPVPSLRGICWSGQALSELVQQPWVAPKEGHAQAVAVAILQHIVSQTSPKTCLLHASSCMQFTQDVARSCWCSAGLCRNWPLARALTGQYYGMMQ